MPAKAKGTQSGQVLRLAHVLRFSCVSTAVPAYIPITYAGARALHLGSDADHHQRCNHQRCNECTGIGAGAGMRLQLGGNGRLTYAPRHAVAVLVPDSVHIGQYTDC